MNAHLASGAEKEFLIKLELSLNIDKTLIAESPTFLFSDFGIRGKKE